MTTANLASRFCTEVINIEKNQAADARRFFGALDFSKGVGQISEAALDQITTQISSKMWGRPPSEAELDAFRSFKAGFYDAIEASQKNVVLQTEKFALGVCTAGLASYEAMSL